MGDKEDSYESDFIQLVTGIYSSAWMMMGKVMNPLTGKMERNLEGAKTSIDTLVMLKEKTKGNLSKPEEQFLSNILQQLQLNYIEEVKREGSKEKSEEEGESKKETQKTPKEEEEKKEKSDKTGKKKKKGKK